VPKEGAVERARELRARSTPAEEKLWTYLKDHRFLGHHFRRQQPIAGFYADFYCDALGLVIELDGTSHDDQARYDAERDALFEGMGLTVMRARNGQILPVAHGFLLQLRRWIEGRPSATPPGSLRSPPSPSATPPGSLRSPPSPSGEGTAARPTGRPTDGR
jgi:very-short-patch-repair endonuclease